MNHHLSLTQYQSQIIKGIAILVMIYHHFFGGYAVLIDIETLKESDVIFGFFNRFARSGKICISLYAFISGYAFYHIITKENNRLIAATWYRLRKVYIFFIFMCILVYALINMFPCPINFTLSSFFLQLTGYASCIPDYWYISVVLTSILIYFPALLWGHRKGIITHHAFYFSLMTINMFIAISPHTYNTWGWHFMLPFYKIYYTGIVSQVVLTVPFVMLGYSFHRALKNQSKQEMIVFAATIGFCLFSYNPKWSFAILACVFVTNSLLSKASVISKPLAYLGKYSMCMWLNHRLVFGYWFTNYFYSLPTPLNYMIVVIISLALSIIITKSFNVCALYLCKNITLH